MNVRLRIGLLVLHIMVVAQMLSAQTAAHYTTVKDIQYKQGTDAYVRERCKLDVYYNDSLRNCPVVVWFHGGGLTSGSKQLPQKLRNKGLVIVGVNYRLLPKVNIDECLDDCAAAVAWAFANVNHYGGDARKIFVSGHSAGGYITSMLGLDKSWLARYGVDADSIAGLIPLSGQMISHFAYRKMEGIGERRPIVDRYAPLYHVRKDAPPMVLVTGDRDFELLGRYEENAYMCRMMKIAGHSDVPLYEISGHGHNPMLDPAYHIVIESINRILGRKYAF